jgi:hypothetical protein
VCPFCRENISSTHLLDCQGITPNPICRWDLFVSDFQQENYSDALDRLFLVIQRWTILSNRFQASLSAHLDEYFSWSDFPVRRRDSSWRIFHQASI